MNYFVEINLFNMKILNSYEMESINGGSLIDIIDGICGGASLSGTAVAIGIRLGLLAATTGGTGLIVVGGACAVYGAWRLFS